MIVPRTTRLQFLVVRPSFWLSENGCAWVSELGRQNLWLSFGQLHQMFWLSGNLFGCPGRTDNRNIERCPYTMYTLIPGHLFSAFQQFVCINWSKLSYWRVCKSKHVTVTKCVEDKVENEMTVKVHLCQCAKDKVQN